MTFIHDNVAIVGNDVVHDLFAVQALNHGNVNNAAGTSRSAPDLANRFDRQIQKCREPLAASGVSKKIQTCPPRPERDRSSAVGLLMSDSMPHSRAISANGAAYEVGCSASAVGTACGFRRRKVS